MSVEMAMWAIWTTFFNHMALLGNSTSYYNIDPDINTFLSVANESDVLSSCSMVISGLHLIYVTKFAKGVLYMHPIFQL